MEESIKGNLLVNNQQVQFNTIIFIKRHLESLPTKHQRYKYINWLIQLDIASIMCTFVAVNDGYILRTILSCLTIFSESELFYTKNVAVLAVIQILQNGYLIATQSTDKDKILKMMALTLTTIITQADTFQIPLDTIVNKIDQLLEFIINLNVTNSMNPAHILAASNLYAVVLSHVKDLDSEKTSAFFVRLEREILTATNKITQVYVENDNNLIFYNAMRLTVTICDIGLKLCERDGWSSSESLECASNSSEDQRADVSTPIIDIIQKTMLEVVIPNAKITDAPDKENITVDILKCFISCLCQLYKRSDVNINEISKQLIIQGYLKYFYEIMDKHKPLHDICDCLASILTDLAQSNLAIDKWSDGPQGFRRFIKAELISYDKSDGMHINSPTTDALLFLYYFHYLATNDSEILDIVKTIIVVKVISLSVDNLPEISTCQVIWLLFAISVLEDSLDDNNEEFRHALLVIIEIVEKLGAENCYTHHPALPCFVLNNSAFPNKIRDSVVKLWLKSEENVYKLVSPGRILALINCLMNVIETGTEDLAERASKELLRMISTGGNATSLIEQQIIQFMWEKLPVLIPFTSDREGGIRQYLKTLDRLSTTGISVWTAIRCSNSSINTLIQKNLTISGDVKTLLVKHISRMLSVALIEEDGRVVSMYTNNYDILDTLRVQAFSHEHDNLSAACYKCLTDILNSQKQFSVKCTKPLLLRPMDLFNVLLRKAQVYFHVMEFLDTMWVGGIEFPAVLRPTYTENEAKEILTGIYRTYIKIHLEALPIQWSFTFHCLINLLEFCRKHYNVVLIDCCDYVCNHSVVSMTISCEYFSVQFFEFVNRWLDLGLWSQCSFVVHALESKRLRDAGMKEKILFETTFDETIQALHNYITKLVATGQLQADDIKELKSTLATFV